MTDYPLKLHAHMWSVTWPHIRSLYYKISRAAD